VEYFLFCGHSVVNWVVIMHTRPFRSISPSLTTPTPKPQNLEKPYLCTNFSRVTLRFFRKDDKKELLSLADEQLVVRYARTLDKEIIGILYERYTHLLFTVCYKYLGNDADAEDTVMMVFEKLFEQLKKSEIQNFKNWVYTLTKNECLMQLRRKKPSERLIEDNLKKLDSEIMETMLPEHPLSDGNGEHRIRYLETAISVLSSEQKQCIELFYLNEKSYHEVEQITGFTYNEVKSYIQNGKRNLKQMMERMERYE
jgi:RNA polymerase sigma-70 factor, ECF subfamily